MLFVIVLTSGSTLPPRLVDSQFFILFGANSQYHLHSMEVFLLLHFFFSYWDAGSKLSATDQRLPKKIGVRLNNLSLRRRSHPNVKALFRRRDVRIFIEKKSLRIVKSLRKYLQTNRP